MTKKEQANVDISERGGYKYIKRQKNFNQFLAFVGSSQVLNPWLQ